MKQTRKAIIVGSAFLCAATLSFGWSDHGRVALSVASAQARVIHPAAARRHVRHGAYLGAAVVGATAVGAAAFNSGYGYGPGSYEAYDAAPYGAYGAGPYPYGAYGYGYSGCAPGPRVGAFATAPWTGPSSCMPY